METSNFDILARFETRLNSAKTESDNAFFYDLLLYGELIVKITSLFLIANLNEDKDRNRYRHLYRITRAGGIGDFSQVIMEILSGPASGNLSSAISDYELIELNNKIDPRSWQKEALYSLIDCLKLFEIDYTQPSAKTPFRVWFTLFASLRNKTKGHGAPTAEKISKACLLLEKSLSNVVNNLTLFKRPWAFLHRNLNGKYRVSAISKGNSASFDFLKREKDHSYKNGIYCYTDSIRRVELLYSDPELTNYYFPNGSFNDKNIEFEALSYIDDQKKYFEASEYVIPPAKLPQSITEGKPALDVVKESFTNVPDIAEEYIHRENLESELISVLKDKDRFPVITLKGRGGIGKTSLAINVIHDFYNSHPDRFSLIIWFSARDVDLFPNGPKQVQSGVITQEDISKEYCKLVYPDVTVKNPLQQFSNDLSSNKLGPTLFILDNFETISNPTEVFEWINTYVRNPNKVLITSRINRNFKADYPIEVHGMTEEQSRELIDRFANKYHIQHLLSSKYIDDLIGESNGHPYILKIMLGEIARTMKAEKINRIIADKDDILNALFRRTFQTLSPGAKRVFLTLCSWDSIIPIVALVSVIVGDENERIDVEEAVEELQKSSFIEFVEDADGDFIRVPLAASLYGQTELKVYPEKLAVYNDRKLLMEFGATNSGSVKNGIAPLVERKFKRVSQRINNVLEFKREQETLEYLATKFPKAWLWIADMHLAMDNYEEAKAAIREFLKTTTLPNDKIKYWQRYADLCEHSDDWTGESMAIVELSMVPNVPFHIISNGAYRVNHYFSKHTCDKNMESRNEVFSKIAQVMSSRIKTEGDATDYSRLAWLYLNLNDEDLASKYTLIGLSLDPFNVYCEKLKSKLRL